ncbi:DNA-binding transcriptional regulator, XRE-family HTH domain [Paenibacillus uliginis N3/975]|uniref:DNA-binding transcriptional regulator, XRE-family HTH domain n=1 Tax=Paenibacillus uliginis N3/975 TaxID=1313296 RepID=A0A1X7HKS7_9BACL|nr:helix-turn-helix transcriptional regulator [Paenibacillus uliginis]SMF88100.1 DNA-binding transcriptional regulator, XRE-family HTH domain [Paenibacillus uliginis N3/975]
MSFQLGDCTLLERLNEKGWTQAEFAKRMGVSRQYVSKLINGERKMSLEFAFNAAHILGCRITDLYILKVVRRS